MLWNNPTHCKYVFVNMELTGQWLGKILGVKGELGRIRGESGEMPGDAEQVGWEVCT